MITEHSLPDQEIFLIGFKAPPELLSVAANILECRFSEGLARRAYLYSKAIEAVGVGLDSVTHQSGGTPLKPLTGEELKRLHAAISLIEQH